MVARSSKQRRTERHGQESAMPHIVRDGTCESQAWEMRLEVSSSKARVKEEVLTLSFQR